MELNVSKPVKILALLGVFAALSMFVGMKFLGSGSAEAASAADLSAQTAQLRAAAAAKRPKPAKPATPAANVAVKAKPARKLAKTAKAAKATAKPAVAKPAPVQPRPVAQLPPPVALNPDLPTSIASALRRNEVVVVTLFSPKGKVDGLSLGEAEAGAAIARVGFVALNVFDQRQAKPLAEKLGVLRSPSVLVFVRPGDVKWSAPGFADRDTVAQAAMSLKSTGTAAVNVAVTSTWGAAANEVCAQAWAGADLIGPNATMDDLKAWLPGAMAREQDALRRLKLLPAPATTAERKQTQQFLAALDALAAIDRTMAASLERNELAKLESQTGEWSKRVKTAATLGNAVGAPDCTFSA